MAQHDIKPQEATASTTITPEIPHLDAKSVFSLAVENDAKKKKEEYSTVSGKIQAFLQEKFVTGEKRWCGFHKTFTESELQNLFGATYLAVRIFEDLGFKTKHTFGEEVGHLWWRHRTEDSWVVEIPQEFYRAKKE